MSLKVDLNIIHGSDDQTNFGTLLLKLCFKADRSNLEKLRLGFPNAVETVGHYRKTGEVLNLEYD